MKGILVSVILLLVLAVSGGIGIYFYQKSDKDKKKTCPEGQIYDEDAQTCVYDDGSHGDKCANKECGAGTICDPDTGECTSDGCSTKSCPDYLTCDPKSSTCVCTASSCPGPDRYCSADGKKCLQHIDPNPTSKCKGVVCATVSEPELVCDETTGRCVCDRTKCLPPKRCGVDSDGAAHCVTMTCGECAAAGLGDDKVACVGGYCFPKKYCDPSTQCYVADSNTCVPAPDCASLGDGYVRNPANCQCDYVGRTGIAALALYDSTVGGGTPCPAGYQFAGTYDEVWSTDAYHHVGILKRYACKIVAPTKAGFTDFKIVRTHSPDCPPGYLSPFNFLNCDSGSGNSNSCNLNRIQGLGSNAWLCGKYSTDIRTDPNFVRDFVFTIQDSDYTCGKSGLLDVMPINDSSGSYYGHMSFKKGTSPSPWSYACMKR